MKPKQLICLWVNKNIKNYLNKNKYFSLHILNSLKSKLFNKILKQTMFKNLKIKMSFKTCQK